MNERHKKKKLVIRGLARVVRASQDQLWCLLFNINLQTHYSGGCGWESGGCGDRKANGAHSPIKQNTSAWREALEGRTRDDEGRTATRGGAPAVIILPAFWWGAAAAAGDP